MQAWAQSRGAPSAWYTSHSSTSVGKQGNRAQPQPSWVAAAPLADPPPLTLAEAGGGRAAHVEAGLAAALLGPLNLGAARLAAEGRVGRDAQGRGCWGAPQGNGERRASLLGSHPPDAPCASPESQSHPPVCVRCWQAAPLHAGGQRHRCWLGPSTHVPPFWQGLLEHALISAVQKTTHFIYFLFFFPFFFFFSF